MIERKCQNCEFWDNSCDVDFFPGDWEKHLKDREFEPRVWERWCRRFPPSIEYQEDGRSQAGWPSTTMVDWCGEFRPHPDVETEPTKPTKPSKAKADPLADPLKDAPNLALAWSEIWVEIQKAHGKEPPKRGTKTWVKDRDALEKAVRIDGFDVSLIKKAMTYHLRQPKREFGFYWRKQIMAISTLRKRSERNGNLKIENLIDSYLESCPTATENHPSNNPPRPSIAEEQDEF